jgi:hypothetical protein
MNRSTLPLCDHQWDDVSPTDQPGVLLMCTECKVYERTGTRSLAVLQDEWEDAVEADRRRGGRKAMRHGWRHGF